jgi:predicted peptidase
MKKHYFSLFIFSVFFFSFSCKKNNQLPPQTPQEIIETLPPVQTPVTSFINANCGGFYKALPARYDSTTKKYPLLVFVHGLGEIGDGASNLSRVLANAVPKLIKDKRFPPNFNVDGKNYSFVVISPQYRDWPSPGDLNAVINYALNNFRIDTSRIYVTGLSMGGGVTWEHAAANASRLAAIAPICGASWPDDTRAQQIAAANLPVWAFHNNDDGTVPVHYTNDYVSKINGHNPNPPARKTIWPSGGHNAWTKASDPNYKENGMNMYEWMLQYHR